MGGGLLFGVNSKCMQMRSPFLEENMRGLSLEDLRRGAAVRCRVCKWRDAVRLARSPAPSTCYRDGYVVGNVVPTIGETLKDRITLAGFFKNASTHSGFLISSKKVFTSSSEKSGCCYFKTFLQFSRKKVFLKGTEKNQT